MLNEKLVRDRIPEIMQAHGVEPHVRTVAGPELFDALIAKLAEEAGELRSAGSEQERVEELADVLEVLLGLAHHLGFGFDDIGAVAAAKREERGAFERGFVLRL